MKTYDIYDPTLSSSYVAAFGDVDDLKILETCATKALEDSHGLMTDDLIEKVQGLLLRFDEPTAYEWFLEYMRLHYETYKTHFTW
jgi:uncharacterized membrane protein (UPF0127 family)